MSAGAVVLDDLVGNYFQPVFQQPSQPSSYGENVTVSQQPGATTLAARTMSPIRVNASVAVSRQLIVQGAMSVENWLRKEILRAIASKMDQYILSGGGSANNQPTGILSYPQNVNGGNLVNKITYPFTFGGVASYNTLVNAISSVTSQNVIDDGTMAFIVGTQTEKKWNQTEQISGSNFPRYLIENGKAVDKPVFVTNNLSAANSPPGEQCVFGRFSDCVVGLWGGVDFLSNPFVYADAGIIQLDINVLFSFTLLHATAFTISTDSGAQ